jgi:hypothetical protein
LTRLEKLDKKWAALMESLTAEFTEIQLVDVKIEYLGCLEGCEVGRLLLLKMVDLIGCELG